MSVELNHMILHASDRERTAEFLRSLLDLTAPCEHGPFLVAELANHVSLDVMRSPSSKIVPQHYAFLVSTPEFDDVLRRLQGDGSTYWADPFHLHPRRVGCSPGGRGLYVEDPDGHNIEVLTQAVDAS